MEPIITKGHQRKAICALAAVNVGSLALAINLVLVLNPEDRISAKRGLALTALGFAYFTSLFELLNAAALSTGAGARFRQAYRLSSGDVLDITNKCFAYFTSLFELLNAAALSTGAGARFRQAYRLSSGDVLDITNKLVSAVQAAFCVVTGAVVCLWSCSRDFMLSSHYMSEAYAWFGAAYFFYDIWSMYMVHVQMSSSANYKSKLQKKVVANGSRALPSGEAARRTPPSFLQYCRHEPVILMHHLFIGGFGFLVIVYFRGDFGDCTFGFVYLMELSTPFVSLRGILSRLRLKASRAYLANGVLMLLTFFVCRVASLPYVCLLYSRVKSLPYLEAVHSLPTGCKISICILLLPQIYWFYLMSAGAFKMAAGSRAPLADEQDAGDEGGDARDSDKRDSDKRDSDKRDKRS